MNNIETIIVMPADEIFYAFFIMNERFTIEDYADGYAVFHEGMFIGELSNKDDHKTAHTIALDYMYTILYK